MMDTRTNGLRDRLLLAFCWLHAVYTEGGAWFEAEIAGKPERIKVLSSELAEGSGGPGAVLNDELVVACATGAVRHRRFDELPDQTDQLFVVDRMVVNLIFRFDIIELIEEIDHRLDGVLNASAVLPGDLQPPAAWR